MAGLPIDSACSSISRLLGSFQDTTHRLYQSNMAARYMNPSRIGM